MAHGTGVPERRFEYVSMIVFAIVTALLSSRHEPWHDELQAWRIALESSTLPSLFANLRYEGHPPLFHLVLRAVGAVTESWTAVVGLHWLIACGSAWLVLWWSPFTRLQRVLIVAGYFVVYEYAVIVRPYGPGLFCALAACVAWCAAVRRTKTSVVFLILLANTSAVGLLLAVPIAVAMLVDAARAGSAPWLADPANRRRATVIAATAIVMMLAIGMLILPPGDALFKGGMHGPLSERLWVIGRALSIPARVILPFPDDFADGATAWSTWRFEPLARLSVILADLTAMMIVLVVAMIVSRRAAALALWLTACTVFLGFFALVYHGGMRHHGYLVVALFAATWLAYSPRRSARVAAVERWTMPLEPLRRSAFTALLVPMVLVTMQVGLADFREPFSDASDVAALLRSDSTAALPVLGVSYPWSQPVGALLNRRIYVAAEARYSTFVARRDVVEGAALVARTDSIAAQLFSRNCQVILLTGEDDEPLLDLRTARQLRKAKRTPMSGDPLNVWLLTAPRCRKTVTSTR